MVEYPKRDEVHWPPPRARGKGKWVDDPGGHGTQIVRELRACELCFAKRAAIERQRELSSAERRAA